MVYEDAVAALPMLQDFASLVTRHWNIISHTLRSGEVFTSLLLEDEQGVSRGNDWANCVWLGTAAPRGSLIDLRQSLLELSCEYLFLTLEWGGK